MDLAGIQRAKEVITKIDVHACVAKTESFTDNFVKLGAKLIICEFFALSGVTAKGSLQIEIKCESRTPTDVGKREVFALFLTALAAKNLGVGGE